MIIKLEISKVRKEQLDTVNNWIKNRGSGYELLCGDFNDEPHSGVHQYLISNQWIDVAQLKENQDKHSCSANFRLWKEYKFNRG